MTIRLCPSRFQPSRDAAPGPLQRKEGHRVYSEYGGRIGDVKLRGFQRTYVRGVRLIQQHGRVRRPSLLRRILGSS
jgi:hypothetical protein